MAFSLNTRNRCWFGVIHIGNMKKAGLTKSEYENPEYLADKFIGFWKDSGKGREAGIAVCVSLRWLLSRSYCLLRKYNYIKKGC